MRTIKQPEGSKSCGAAVAAMILDKDLEDVLDGKEETCLSRTSSLARYLLDNGWMMGTGLSVNKRIPGRDLTIDVKLDNQLAILSVPSQSNPEWSHWVLWDGVAGYVRDPNPKAGEFRLLTSYKVQELWFVSDMREV